MFTGCMAALVTPFREGSVDFVALDGLVDHLLAGGVSGLVPCGTTGESPTLGDDERNAVIAAVARRVRSRVPVIAGTGTNSTARSVDHSRAALEAGADGVMLVAPYYNRPSQAGLYEHFSAVARKASAPIILYNIPGRTGVEISVETIARLHADHRHIVAVKHATGSLDGASELAATCDIAILSGDDSLTLPLISVGAVGVISVLANLLPAEMSALTTAAVSGDLRTAQKWHRKLFPLARGLLKLDTNPIPIKTALALRGLMAEEFRLPLCSMGEDQRRRLADLLAESGGQSRATAVKP